MEKLKLLQAAGTLTKDVSCQISDCRILILRTIGCEIVSPGSWSFVYPTRHWTRYGVRRQPWRAPTSPFETAADGWPLQTELNWEFVLVVRQRGALEDLIQ